MVRKRDPIRSAWAKELDSSPQGRIGKFGAMTNPRYEPRFMMREPDSYGRTAQGVFFSMDESVQAFAMARAAQFQHRWAFVTRQKLSELRWRGVNQQEFAVRTGITYQRLSRLLNGSIVLRLEDIAACEAVLGSGAYNDILKQTPRTDGRAPEDAETPESEEDRFD